ncbi:hypothetical protein GCM10027614_22980 [Micromonospora vulcania]
MVGFRYLPLYLYQRQVLAACAEAEAITAENHREVLRAGAPGADNATPTDLLRLDLAGLLRMLSDRTVRVTAVFDDLGERSTPGSLAGEKAAVDRRFAEWIRASNIDIEVARTGLRDDMTLAAATKTPFFLDSRAADAGAHLNTAMGDLAGRDCTAIASVPPIRAS